MKLKVTLAQIYPRLGDIEYNIEKHIEISKRVRGKTQLLVFPELSLTGFNLMDLTPEIALMKDSKVFYPLLELSKDLDILFGIVELDRNNSIYNSAFYYSNSSLKYVQHKLFLTSSWGLGGRGYFSAGSEIKVLDLDWGRLGIIISDDALNPIGILPFIQKKIDMLIIISNSLSSGYSPGSGIPKSALMWRNLVSLYAQLCHSYVIYVNRVGFEDGINFFGGSCVLNPYGDVVISCPYFEETLVDVELDLCYFKDRPSFLSYSLDRLELIARELRDEN